jgi:hypothetical protein
MPALRRKPGRFFGGFIAPHESSLRSPVTKWVVHAGGVHRLITVS